MSTTLRPRRGRGLMRRLQIQRIFKAAGLDVNILPRRRKRRTDPPKIELSPLQDHVLRISRERLQAEIRAWGPNPAARDFSRRLAERFEEFLPPCSKCLTCRRRMENGLMGDGHFCDDCVRVGWDVVYRAERERQAMRAYFGLGPGQRLSKKQRNQFLIDTVYGKTPSLQEIYYGTHTAQEAAAEQVEG